ncbi:MAG: hypothetical protein HYV26_13285 [Candidatus Hydrogenedentes bacterium]|nr:hypothetical protein [Candidatus Hydrogenedentota bacterium]
MMLLRMAASFLLGGSFCLLTFPASASRMPSPVLDPTTYVSPSGDHTLYVKPSQEYGIGPAEYQAKRHDEIVWSTQLPFTLYEACVADSGLAAGYAYTHGKEGCGLPEDRSGPGQLLVVLLDPRGDVINQVAYPRAVSQMLHADPNPLVEGVILGDANHRFMVRIAPPDFSGLEEWWAYDLATGQRTGALVPGRHMERTGDRSYILTAKALPGTPLTLIHWWKYDKPNCGAIFTLIDPVGKLVWRLDVEDDYTLPGNEAEEDRIRDEVREKGAILSVSNGAFELRLYKSQVRTGFTVESNAEGTWRVQETSRNPFLAQEPAPLPEFPTLTPQPIGIVSLASARTSTANPIHDVAGFAFDAQGRMAVLRKQDTAPAAVLLVTQEGEVLIEMLLPVQPAEVLLDYAGPVWVGGSKFVAAISREQKATIYLLDSDARALDEAVEHDCPPIKALTGFPDGSFVTLSDRPVKYSRVEGLFSFSPTGERLWSKEQEGYGGQPDELLDPAAICTIGGTQFAVLNTVGGTIQVFNTKGGFVRVLNLEEQWGRAPNYLTNIAEDTIGGFVLYDFNVPAPLIHMTGEGKILRKYRAVYPNARPVPCIGGLRVSPQGDVWMSDGDAIVRLTAEGQVDRVLGAPPDAEVLTEPCMANVGPDGRIYITDDRSAAVHVFDADGTCLGVCKPDPATLSTYSFPAHVAVRENGDILVWYIEPPHYVRFNRLLERLGPVQGLPQFTDYDDWYFSPKGDTCWMAKPHDVLVIQGLRDIVHHIKRHADGCWIESPEEIAFAPDGRAAMLARGQTTGQVISTYTADGEPLTTFFPPADWVLSGLAFDGIHIFALRDHAVHAFSMQGAPLGQFELPLVPNEASYQGPFLSAAGKELWFVEVPGPLVHKYVNPFAG